MAKAVEMADEASATDEAPAAPVGAYHFLDVGGTKYGECILIEFGSHRILVDGSHQQDFKGQRGYRSIPTQLADVLGGEAPHEIDLVVVTHGHADHIGCLPDLIENDIIRPRHALLTDPGLGFGRLADDDDASQISPAAARLQAALREEDASDLDDVGLDEFMDAAEAVEPRYARFIEMLGKVGTTIHLHRGGPLPAEVQRELSETGIKLLGPSLDQLLRCAEQISKTNKEAEDAVLLHGVADTEEIKALYRQMVGNGDDDVGYTRGNGMNCQSVTLAFGPAGSRVLLAGDMQFAEPGVRYADSEVAKLREAVIAAGPYAVFKTTHHTSHNGQDDAFLDALGSPKVIVHCGGLRDEKHPYPSVLNLLRKRNVTFARTDRNGMISVRPSDGTSEAITIQRGTLNDFEPNVLPDETKPTPIPPSAEVGPVPVGVSPRLEESTSAAGVQIVILNLPAGPIDMTVAGIDIVVRGPATARSSGGARVRSGGGAAPQPVVTRDRSLGDLSDLLFVTDPDRLRQNIGRSEADEAIDTIGRRGGKLVFGSGDGMSDQVTAQLRGAPSTRGIVLLGGYDVVPAHRVDSLDPELRQKLRSEIPKDGDQFWVWSDASYADLDGDGIAELPVSRIPDARDARLIRAALRSDRPAAGGRFGVRNVARPFADEVWKEIPEQGEMRISEPYRSSQLVPQHLQADCHYIMLHGDHRNGRTFVGEDGSSYPVAFEVGQVPSSFSGVVLAGCCWGALVVDGRAFEHVDAMPPPRVTEASVALSYLRAGALAFVGCTGSHYSGPSLDPDVNYALRMHSAFWEYLRQSESPADALHQAKQEYAGHIVRSGRLDPLDTARRLKNLAQFTCLGLGWR